MTANEFTEQVGRIRDRFAAALPAKIADSFAALEIMSGRSPDAVETVILAHRRLHELCGIAPTLGFETLGRLARSAESVVREAASSRRAATPGEIAAFKCELERLSAAADGALKTLRPGQAAPPASDR